MKVHYYPKLILTHIDEAELYSLKKDFFFRETCLHPDASSTTCSKIINAHTIQRKKSLEKIIGKNKKVLTFYPFSLGKDELPQEHPKGWKEASTFLGFCKNHDDRTFAPIEKEELQLNKMSAFLLAYRAICHEYYQSENKLNAAKRSNSKFSSLLSYTQLIQQEKITKQIRNAKEKADHELMTKNYGAWSFVFLSFSGTIHMVSTGVHFPCLDFFDRPISRSFQFELSEHLIYVSLVAKASTPTLCLGWRPNVEASQSFINSILAYPSEKLGDRLSCFLLTHIENTYFSKAWWESLDELQRLQIKKMLSIMNPCMHPLGHVDAQLCSLNDYVATHLQ